MSHRNAFIQRLQNALIGPGGDVFGIDDQVELTSNPPLQMYYSGILFPERSQARTKEEQVEEETVPGLAPAESAISAEENTNHTPLTTGEADKDPILPSNGDAEENAARPVGEANHFYPSNMGLTFCLPETFTQVELEVSCARYLELSKNWRDRKIRIDLHLYESILNHPQFPQDLKQAMVYEPLSDTAGILSMPGLPTSFSPTDARKKLAVFRQHAQDKLPTALKRFELLLSSKMYQRIPLSKVLTIDLRENAFPLLLDEKGKVLLKCFLKVVSEHGKKYVKVLLANAAAPHPRTKFALSNETLNQKALFQVSLKVKAPEFCPYKDHLNQNPFDEEGQLIAYQYRNVAAFGIGHGCAVQWESVSTPTWVQTTFLPVTDIPGVSNDFRPGQEHLKEVARLRNLSIWSQWSKDNICDSLTAFVQAYSAWIDTQKEKAKREPAEYLKWSDQLIAGQEQNLKRLLANVKLLRTDNKVFECFTLANTAMYIQMVISQDSRFGKEEKEWNDCKLFDQEQPSLYNDLSFFQQYDESESSEYRGNRPIAYRPFQLAFLLLNLESTINPASPDRTDVVDLLWFPTGGGKTEAYLALTAFTILWRRTQFPTQCAGVSVIMRYTLRLLTAQQFERASRLIVSLEFMRRKQNELPVQASLGDTPISIGMWVGQKTTPNKLEEAKEKLGVNSQDYNTLDYQVRLLNKEGQPTAARAYEKNPFQVAACPWCGCRLITKNNADEFRHGYSINGRLVMTCRNLKCSFHSPQQSIPLDVVDESLYKQPPTLLFATVDKFAQLSHVTDGHVFFNSINQQNLPPDLIIQDELHLLNGPLGSVVGLFELMVEMLCSRPGRGPKIIASTATTRNTAYQIRGLYGNRSVNIFPAPGLTQDDSYFSVVSAVKRRRHVGFMATGKTQLDTQVKALMPNLLFTRALLYQENADVNELNPYWTIVSYYNTLKSVGKIYNKVGDEILAELRRLHHYYGLQDALNFNYAGVVYRTSELTSRVDSTKIKQTLSDLEQPLQIRANEQGRLQVSNNTVDLVLASNMFSVGIDIGRLNVMLMNGQPKNSAEYIQASSRVARQQEGLVINLLDANIAREKSYFENYITFHQAYYQYVEPLTVTPFTEITFEKVLNSILICYVRQLKKLPKNSDAQYFDGNITDLILCVRQRISHDPAAQQYAEDRLRELAAKWLIKISDATAIKTYLKYKEDLIRPADEMDEWSLMQSMREIDTNSLIAITLNPIETDGTQETEQE